MSDLSRRRFLELAAALGASAVFRARAPTLSAVGWRERRDLYPEGVASGDPSTDSVLLWTRRARGTVQPCRAPDRRGRRGRRPSEHVVASARGGDLRRIGLDLPRARRRPAARRASTGIASPTTRATAAASAAPSRRRATTTTASGAVRVRELPERQPGRAERLSPHDLSRTSSAAAADRLGFVLHLGDFIYEIVWYPEDRPQGMYDRRLRDIVRYANGEKVARLPRADDASTTTAPSTAPTCTTPICRTHGRAGRSSRCGTTTSSRWMGWQGLHEARRQDAPGADAQGRGEPGVVRVSAGARRQAGRARRSIASIRRRSPTRRSRASTNTGSARSRTTSPQSRSLTAYRSLSCGPQRRSSSSPISTATDRRSRASRPRRSALQQHGLPELCSRGSAGDPRRRTGLSRRRSRRRRSASVTPRCRTSAKIGPPQTILGAEQKAWFLERLQRSTRDLEDLGQLAGHPRLARRSAEPSGRTDRSRGQRSDTRPSAAAITAPPTSSARRSTTSIRDAGITGFATVAGDRHSFWAGLAAKALPPAAVRAGRRRLHHGLDLGADPRRGAGARPAEDAPAAAAVSSSTGPAARKPHAAVNLLDPPRRPLLPRIPEDRRHLARARRVEPALSPHLSFLDMGATRLRHGAGHERRARDRLRLAFRGRSNEASGADGGPLRYRVRHRARAVEAGRDRRGSSSRCSKATRSCRPRRPALLFPPNRKQRRRRAHVHDAV